MRIVGIPICLFLCFFGIFWCPAQSILLGNSPVFTGSFSEAFTGPFSFISNPASLAYGKNAGAGIYAENKFGLKELKNCIAALSMPVNKKDGIGLLLSYSGNTDFNQSQAGLAYAKALGPVNIGLRFNYTMVRVAGYGNAGVLTYALGSIWKVSEKFYSGIQMVNPQGGKFGKEGAEKLPSIYTMGAGYECSDQLLLSVAIIKEENKGINVQAGIQYIFDKSFFAVLAVNSNTASPGILIGWQQKLIRVFVNGSFHPRLGPSSGVGILLMGKKKKEPG